LKVKLKWEEPEAKQLRESIAREKIDPGVAQEKNFPKIIKNY
jgi:hypothetical protein